MESGEMLAPEEALGGEEFASAIGVVAVGSGGFGWRGAL